MIAHGLGDLQAISALALKAGLDMDMVGEGFLTTLKKSLEEGKVTEAKITSATRRILEAKYKLGLFDDPYRYIDKKRPAKDILTTEHKKIAREVAAKTFVLLKKHKNVLRLKKEGTIALIGDLANSKNNMLATWAPTGEPQLSVPLLQGFKNVAPNAKISYAKGANITNDEIMAKNVNIFGATEVIDERTPEEMLNEAGEVAVVGEATEMTGESSSRTDIQIPASQKKLIHALVDTGKPVVLVLMSGRPLVIEEELGLPLSMLQVWFPGVEAGNAIADVVFGDYNPSGKLTTTWPINVGQIPIYRSIKNTGRPQPTEEFLKFKSNYLDAPNTPLLPFGFGLSYTDFEYSDVKVAKTEIDQDESLAISVTLKNTGNYDGEEVVQLYLKDVVRTITPPNRELKGFKKVFLKKGETKTITLNLQPANLKFYNADLDFVPEAGDFEVFVGTDSNATLKASFTLR